MNYGKIKTFDVANGEGIRTSLFVSGCRNKCNNCFNPETHSFKYGKRFTDETLQQLLDSLKPAGVAGLTILGGEPLEPENQEEVLNIVRKVKENYPHKTIWLYTGFTWEQLHDVNSRSNTHHIHYILSCIDVLVDGRFDFEKRDLKLHFRGSENQRIIDVPLSLRNGALTTIYYD